MDAFSYLSVLLSIIVGLAMTQVLSGYRALMLSRRAVRFYPPSLIWSAIILLMATQSWWSSFGLARHSEWTFLTFSVVLLQTILLYLLAALVLPDVAPDVGIDLAQHYHREATPFFAILLGMLAVSLGKDVVLDGHLPSRANLAFHLLFAAIAVGALGIRARWYHQVAAPAVAIVALAYIGLLYARL